MKLNLDESSLAHIAKIQAWFRDAFGFIPSRKQVILFTIQSINTIVADVVVRQRMRHRGVGVIEISIPDEFAKVLEYYVASTGDLFFDCSFLMDILLMHRAYALPKIEKKELEVLTPTPTKEIDFDQFYSFMKHVEEFDFK